MKSNIKNNIIIVLIVLLVIATFAAIGFCVATFEAKRNLKIQKDNNLSLMEKAREDSSGHAYQLRITQSQLREYYGSYIDSLNNTHQAEKIKLNRILSVTQINLQRAYDQIKILTSDTSIYLPGKLDTLFLTKKGKFVNSCLNFDILYPEGQDYFLVNGKLDIGIDLLGYEGKRRNQVKIGRLKLFRYGGRLTEYQAFSTCDSTKISIRDIKILDKE